MRLKNIPRGYRYEVKLNRSIKSYSSKYWMYVYFYNQLISNQPISTFWGARLEFKRTIKRHLRIQNTKKSIVDKGGWTT